MKNNYFYNENEFKIPIKKHFVCDDLHKQENKNFFPPNTKLVVYNLFDFNNLASIYYFCKERANFIDPLEIFYSQV